jgi:hypothetical protein
MAEHGGSSLSFSRAVTFHGWIFFYTSREYLETREISAMVTGNGPIIVEKSDGSITQLGTARPFEDYLKEYEIKRGHCG